MTKVSETSKNEVEKPTVKSEVKKALMEKVKENPNGKDAAVKQDPAIKEGPGKAPQMFVFTPQGFQDVNNFLALAGESEKQGILDYKAAFHTLVAKVRAGIKPM